MLARSIVRTAAAAALLAAPLTGSLAAQERLGTVHFATSCRADVAPRFDRAVALLHSFEFGDAIRAFGDVAGADSTCAMAHWGIALARWTNPMSVATRPPAALAAGRAAAAAATRLAPGATPRERAWIAAVSALYDDYEHVDQPTRFRAYERAMADLTRREPADTEARIFHAIALAAAASPTDKSYADLTRAGEELEALWKAQPDHPGLAHYIIHSYDVPALAPRAAAAAERYAAIAPSAAHALHMPSHTFTRVGEWQQSVDANVRSAEAAVRTGSIAEALHASDYLVYAYLQMRRDSAARAVMATLPSLRARFDPAAVTGAAPGSAGVFALAAIPARWALERGAWAEAAALEPRPSAFAWADAVTWYARALGAARSADTVRARVAADTLDALRARLASAGERYWAEQVAIQALSARAWVAFASGHRDAALAAMRQAADHEDATEKSAVTPGPLAPARELLGDMLLELRRRPEARAEYQRVLRKEPNRRRALDGAAAASRA